MDNKMMLPANYCVMDEEEMTYTCGGDSNPITSVLSMFGVPTMIIAAVSVANMIWGVSNTRSWIQKNKSTDMGSAEALASLVVNGIDSTVSYASKSVWNAVVTVCTAGNLLTWWPVTAIAWITA